MKMQYKILINLQTTPFGNAGKSVNVYSMQHNTQCGCPYFQMWTSNDASCISGSHHFTLLQKTKQKLLHPFGENKTLSAESETLRSSPNAELKKV